MYYFHHEKISRTMVHNILSLKNVLKSLASINLTSNCCCVLSPSPLLKIFATLLIWKKKNFKNHLFQIEELPPSPTPQLILFSKSIKATDQIFMYMYNKSKTSLNYYLHVKALFKLCNNGIFQKCRLCYNFFFFQRMI